MVDFSQLVQRSDNTAGQTQAAGCKPFNTAILEGPNRPKTPNAMEAFQHLSTTCAMNETALPKLKSLAQAGVVSGDQKAMVFNDKFKLPAGVTLSDSGRSIG
jgi:hypothetical protein